MLKKKIKYFLNFKSPDQKLLFYNLLLFLFECKKNLNYINKTSLIFAPYKYKKFCILRSPFVDKISREFFELRIFKNILILEIVDPENIILEKLFEASLINTIQYYESDISYKKIKITSF
jgi:ribosomal protein S10